MTSKFLAKKYWNKVTSPMAEFYELSNKYDDIINLSLGDPDIITDNSVIEAAFHDAEKGHTRYTETAGDPELINEIIKYYDKSFELDIEKSEVMAVVGACHGMYLVLQAILDEGDEVIVHEPYFSPYIQQINMAGGKPVILKTDEKDEFNIDIDRLKGLITDKTKAIVINSPNNPTGACFSKKLLEEIAKIAVENDILIISDEVYDAFCFEEPFCPIASLPDMKDRTITLGSFSKDYAMTGWRIGYVIAPKAIIECIKDINEGICFTAPSISQRAAIHALRQRENIQPQIVDEFKRRVFYAYERISAIGKLSVCAPKGSIYLFVNIGKSGLSSFEFSKRLLEEARVLVIPGGAFGEAGEGYIRIACTVNVDKLKEAFDRIENMLKTNKI